MDLLELADRVEGLSGPCRETDEAIQAGLVGAVIEWSAVRQCNVYHKDGHWVSIGLIPAYTASLDAAMQLVPEGMEGLPLSFKVERFYLGNGTWQSRASVWDGLGGVSSLDTASIAATPFLALTAAALRARATIKDRA